MGHRAIVVLVSAPASPALPTVKQDRGGDLSKADLRAVGGVVVEAAFRISDSRSVYLIRTFSGWDGSALDRSVWAIAYEFVIPAKRARLAGSRRAGIQ